MSGAAERTGAMTSSMIHVCRLAEGGMGRVDLAMRRVGGFERMYAIKRLHPHLASDPDFRSMFLDEARIAGRLRHPNVVGVLDVGEDEQGPFLVMDYVDGLPLSNLMRLARNSGDLMPVQLCARIGLAVAQGLHAAHEVEEEGKKLGLVHRDLTPQNIMLGWDGSVRISDFGIAKALGRTTKTATGVVKGKLAYMAPEQIIGKGLDHRTDLYSLGIVLFEMLSGERFHGRRGKDVSPADVVAAEIRDIGELRYDVPDELVRLLFELLAKAPEARPTTAREVALRLEAVLASILAEEDPVDTAEYIDLVAGEMREEQRHFIDQALEDVERSEARRRSGRTRRSIFVALAASALLVGGGVAIATGWSPFASSRDTASEPPAPAVASPPPETSASEPPPALAEEVEPPIVIEAGDPRPRERPRMRRRRRPRAAMMGAAPAEESTEMHRLPEWVGFER